jgi:uncharacterized surface protein with fasciclin (FAS1) repeats
MKSQKPIILVLGMMIFIFGSLPLAFAQGIDDAAYEGLFADVKNTGDHDVLSLLKQDENFSAFVEMIEHSGLDLEKSIGHIGPITVFAPTNEALEGWKDEDDLAEIQRKVKAHILPEKRFVSEFQDNQVIETADGLEIPVGTVGDHTEVGQPDQVIIGGARIVKSDVEASNGIIHVVNAKIRTEERRGGFR